MTAITLGISLMRKLSFSNAVKTRPPEIVQAGSNADVVKRVRRDMLRTPRTGERLMSITQMFCTPSRSDVNAIREPSFDQAGEPVDSFPYVRYSTRPEGRS